MRISVFFSDANNTVSGNAGFIPIKDDITFFDGCSIDGRNGDFITVAYRRVHAVAGSAKLYGVAIG